MNDWICANVNKWSLVWIQGLGYWDSESWDLSVRDLVTMLISGLKETIFEKAAAGNVVAYFLESLERYLQNFLPPS
jgi:hypothetical protein